MLIITKIYEDNNGYWLGHHQGVLVSNDPTQVVRSIKQDLNSPSVDIRLSAAKFVSTIIGKTIYKV